MTPILLRTSLRHLQRHPWQLVLAILGVALGVAVVVAIDLANESARRAFAISAETITGRATHQISGGPRGLDQELYRRLRSELGIRTTAPVIEGMARSDALPGLTLQILGVDPLAEGPFRPYLAGETPALAGAFPSSFFSMPGAVLISADVADRYGLDTTDHAQFDLLIGTRRMPATIVGLLEPADDASRRALDGLLIVDIATAQEWFGMYGQLSRIDLIINEDPAGAATLERIQGILPPGSTIERPERRTQAIQQMTAAFELNLSALSMLALIVGMFLIYNTMTFAVVQRRGMLGTLRCLGVSRSQILLLILGEALLVGLVGALLGLGLGLILGRGLIPLVTQTINDLYFAVTDRSVTISPLPLLKGFALGLLATLAAAALPAAEATSTPPRTVLRRSSYEDRVRRLIPLVAAAGGIMVACGGALLLIPSRNLVIGFAALFAVTIGAAALTPAALLGLMRPLHFVLGRFLGMLGRMAARDVVASISRTSVAVAALMIAVSVTIGVGLMVGSFRQTVERWLEQTIRADVYVSAPGGAANRLDAPLPAAVVEQLAAAPEVERVRRYRSVTLDTAHGPVLTVALDVAPDDRVGFQFLGGDPAQIWHLFETDGLLISEPLAFHYGLQPGDKLVLRTARGEQAFPIAAVFYDYGTDRGVIMLPFERYRLLWEDPTITSLGLYVAPDADVDQVVQALRSRLDVGDMVNIRSNRALRETSLEIFDRTFAITRVLQLLATIVAFIGILAALMALQLERARELGMLRANGLTPGQLWGLVLTQTGLMGLAAGLLAVPVGIAMAGVLVYVINKRSFGWTLLFELDATLFGQALAVAVVAALLAGIYPAWRMARTSPALALREE
ncbi:MAG TPA: FtsX-like permease family protein [Roseiflexaceae bacterium]|nr:FtsX-like permease family protein [Roseiflexaceae bacterium]